MRRTDIHKKEKRKRRRIGLILAAVLGALLLLVAGWALYTYYQLNAALKDMTSDSIIEDVYASEQSKDQNRRKKPVSILLLGLDSRPNLGLMNTDVIMVAALNPNQKSAAVVSIPRDTYVKVDGYRARKANNYYAAVTNLERRGELKSGNAMTEIKKIFGEFLDIPIDYAVVVNFQTLEAIVDELGGIHIDVDMDMRYIDRADGTNIDLKAGPQILDGKKTLDYVRYRQSNDNIPNPTRPSSDFERNQRQLQVVHAIIDKLKSFNAVLKAGDIFRAIGDHIRMDIPRSQIFQMIQTYAGLNNDNINYIPVEGRWQSPYIYLNEEKFELAKQALKDQLRE